MSADIAVIYLARGLGGGAESALRFLDSLKLHPAGAAFTLHVLMKGWDKVPGHDEVLAACREHSAVLHELPDDGFDWGAYFRAADAIKQPKLLFLNTHSQVLGAQWLAHLSDALDEPKCGLAGATGSWGVKDPPLPVLWRMIQAQRGRGGLVAQAGRMAWHAAHRLPRLLTPGVNGRFPNPHLRSNAFIIRRADFLAFRGSKPVPISKEATWDLESGPANLTRHMLNHGLAVTVVGRDGRRFAAQDWVTSGTFRCPDTTNLMIADNQTRAYAAAARQDRQLLELAAWGRVLTA